MVSYYKVVALHDFNNVVMYYEYLVEIKDMQIVGIGTTQEFKLKKWMPLSKLREASMLKISLFDFETVSGKLGKYLVYLRFIIINMLSEKINPSVTKQLC